MTGIIRKTVGLLGKTLLGLAFVTKSLGDTVFDANEISPFLGPNAADPQIRLAGAIMLLFAGSLSILAFGYVIDSTRLDDRSSGG
jgi:hypothetical protein